MIAPIPTDIVGARVRLMGRADRSSIQGRGIVRAVDYQHGAFVLLIEARGDPSWFGVGDGGLFQVSLHDEVTEVVIDGEEGAST